MSFLTHINRYDDSNYNEDYEMKNADSFSEGSEEGLFTFLVARAFLNLFHNLPFVALILCFFVTQVLILEQVEQFIFLYGEKGLFELVISL